MNELYRLERDLRDDYENVPASSPKTDALRITRENRTIILKVFQLLICFILILNAYVCYIIPYLY